MWQVYLKELTELMRDRKTLIFVILLPIFIFPVIFGVMGLVLSSTTAKAMQEQHKYVIVNGDQAPEFAEALFYHKNFKRVESTLTAPEELIAAIRAGEFAVAVVIPDDFQAKQSAVEQSQWQLIYNQSSQLDFMSRYFNELLENYTGQLQRQSLSALGVDPVKLTAILKPVSVQKVDTADKRENIGEKFGALIAYILIPLCLLGASYPAIDMGAGEKERGTLETLLICPVSRSAIVLGKFLTVLTTGLAGALITVASFGIWGAVIGSFAGFAVVQEAMGAIATVELLLIFLMIVPTSAIFASLLLAISIYAKTFKEAQNYMSPLSILMFVPLAAAMMPGVELTTKTAMIPVMNVALAIKELIKGTADGSMIALIFGATVALAAALIAFCVHWFQQEKVLFR
ncbi:MULTISPECIES: ABC transporter permease [Alishewanella]|uniref:ABC-type Na+ efflux pump, permease component n=2 Tax=Alishewanella TaxID=111142 RepID=H3ZIV2_9ALTE|nr:MULTISPECIES: ABC transporter permease [Alishewanella]EHR39421.1 ABC-type Na+ efflux pump, permease component [Alishewanella jeotgali KCTC 22429]EJI85607.1 ABC-type Na+ efflux pump, permease component [Alishewanella aestuarii B11]